MSSFPAIVLAAGASSRCPEGKLSKIYNGQPLLAWTLHRLGESTKIKSVLVICGYKRTEIESITQLFPKARTIFNPSWSLGLSSSLKVGLKNLDGDESGVLLVLGDTPFFSLKTLDAVLPEKEQIEEIRFPSYRGVPGHPKYIPRRLFPALESLRGDQGAKHLIRNAKGRKREILVEDPGILRDFDKPEDFENI